MFRQLLIAALVLTLVVPALAAPARMEVNPEGQPTAFSDKVVGFWVWHDDEGYHVRSTTGSRTLTFTGWVEVDRDIGVVKRVSVEGNDLVAPEDRRIKFRLQTGGNLDGFDFQVAWPSNATFFVTIEGLSGSGLAERIYIGRQNVHPSAVPFTIVPLVAARGLDPAGRPEDYRSGEPKAYWIWRDGSGFHLRATTDRQRHVFSGWIEADGLDVRKVASMEHTDFVVREGRRLYFHLVVQGAEDGFDFSVSGSGVITLFLMIDGFESDETLNRVFVGKKGAHPRDNPFRVRQ